MTHLIDKDAVVAEIKRLKKEDGNPYFPSETADKYYARGVHFTCDGLVNFLDTLEVKDVDLEKEINKYISDNFFGSETMGFFATRTNEEPNDQDIALCAKYFFELGVKIKQESNNEVKIGEPQIYLEDDGGESPYDGKQWLDLSCTEYEIPKTLFKDGDNVEILIRKAQKGE